MERAITLSPYHPYYPITPVLTPDFWLLSSFLLSIPRPLLVLTSDSC